MNHDIIAIGGSAGGVNVLLDLVAELPADLPASIFVVVHTRPEHPSVLPDLLSKRGPLPASHPLHGERIRRGHIYVAPPDNHLLVRADSMEVVRGPRENGHRPAVDALFRSASSAFGSRVVGVVISGYQECGTAGMTSVKARNGITVVQDPGTAAAPDMPRSVLKHVPVDHVVSPRELPSLLVHLAGTSAARATRPDAFVSQVEGALPGTPAGVVCPLCQGVLTEAQPGVFEHFRCHVGHAFSLESLVREQGEALERALWAAVRTLEESSTLSQRLSGTAAADLRDRFAEKASTQRAHAESIRQLLLHGAMLSGPDAVRLTDASSR